MDVVDWRVNILSYLKMLFNEWNGAMYETPKCKRHTLFVVDSFLCLTRREWNGATYETPKCKRHTLFVVE